MSHTPNKQVRFESEREKHALEKAKLMRENLAMKKQLKKAHKNAKINEGNNYMDQIVRQRLKDHFSDETLDLILDERRKFSKNSTSELCLQQLLWHCS